MESELIVGVVLVVGVATVPVQIARAIVVVVHIPQTKVVVRNLYSTPSYTTTFRILYRLNFISYLKYASILYQVISFFNEVSTYTTLSETVISNTLNIWILDSVVINRGQ